MWYGVGNKDGLEGEYMKIYDCFTFYNEFALLEWRLKAFAHWKTLKEPSWAKLIYDKID